MPRPNQGRVKVSVWVKQAALDRVDEAREVEGVDRSEMLRRILGLGLAAWESAKR